jgi:hypothetical protein
MTGRPSESAASHHFAEEPGDLVHAAPVEHELQRRRESPRDPLSRPARPPAAPSSAPALRSLQERACAAEARIAGEQQLPQTALGMLPLHPGNPAELRTMTAQEHTQQAGAAWTRALLSRPAARSSRCGRTPPCARGRGAADTAGAPSFRQLGCVPGARSRPDRERYRPRGRRLVRCCFCGRRARSVACGFACKRRPRSRPRTTSLPRKHSRGHGAARACLRREPQTIWLPSGSPKGAAGPLVVREGPASHGMPSGSSAGRRSRGGSG